MPPVFTGQPVRFVTCFVVVCVVVGVAGGKVSWYGVVTCVAMKGRSESRSMRMVNWVACFTLFVFHNFCSPFFGVCASFGSPREVVLPSCSRSIGSLASPVGLTLITVNV